MVSKHVYSLVRWPALLLSVLRMTTATANLSVDQSHGTQLMISSSTEREAHTSIHLAFSVAVSVEILVTHAKPP